MPTIKAHLNILEFTAFSTHTLSSSNMAASFEMDKSVTDKLPIVGMHTGVELSGILGAWIHRFLLF